MPVKPKLPRTNGSSANEPINVHTKDHFVVTPSTIDFSLVEVLGLPPPSMPPIPVSSVFGRTGAIVAVAGDYASFYQPLGSYLSLPLTQHLTFSPDATYDIGTGVTRPRDLNLGRNADIHGTMAVGTFGLWSAAAIYTLHSTLTGTSQYGLYAKPTGTSGATAGIYGAALGVASAAAAYSTTGYGLAIIAPTAGAGSTFTNLYGVNVANQGRTGVTNAYGIYINAQSGAATNNIGLYNAGTTTLAGSLTAQNGINVTGGALTGNGSVPIGGTTNQVLSKNSATNYDISWKTSAGLPTGGTAGQGLIKNSSSDFDASWATISGGTGGGTVTSFSAGALSPLFTTTVATATTTPALSFILSNVGAGTVFANNSGSSGSPSFVTNPRISAIANLSGDGFVKTSGGNGTLGIDSTAYEPALGTPSTDGQVLSSTASGARSWITPPVSSVFGRTGAVVAAANDYNAAQVTNAVSTMSTYNNPVWLASLPWSKITGPPDFELDLGNPTTDGYVLSSTAAGVRSWISRTAGTGTVTSVGITGSGGILVSGSPITSAGTITLSLPFQLSGNGGGITLASGKSVTLDNSLHFSGVDNSALNIGTGGTLGSAAFTPSTNYEPALGNPASNGQVLTSTTAGVRSWVTPAAAPVASVFGRTGAVVAQSGDYSSFYQPLDTDLTTWATKTPYAGNLTITAAKTLNAISSITIGGTDGKTLTVSNNIQLSGTDGANLNVGNGGALGSAAFTPSTNYALAAAAVPTGGTTGQVLQKNSATNYDASWATPLAGTVTSVGITGSGGILVSGSPVTSAGVIALSLPFQLSGNGGGITLATGKSVTLDNSLHFSGVDNSALNIGTGGTLGSAAYTASTNYEPTIGNPASDGMILSSTAAGVRSWVAPGTGAVTSVFGRTGAVVAAANDYNAAQVTNAVSTMTPYADPGWITALAWSKITGAPAFLTLPLSQHLTFSPDNTYDVGTGVTRPRDLNLGRNATITGTMAVGSGGLWSSVAIYTLHSTLAGSSQYGIYSRPTGTSAGTTGIYGAALGVASANASYSTTGYGLAVVAPSVGAGSTFTNLYGVNIANQGAAGVTAAYGLYIAAQSGAASVNTGLYNAGTTTLAGLLTAQNGISVTGGSAITGNGSVPTGGTTGQLLQKNSATNYDVGWVSPTGGGNVSNSGTPTSGQIAEWISATSIKGTAVTGTGNVVKSASPTFTGTVTAATITPTSITGTTTNDNAVAGAVGETIASYLPFGSSVTYTTGQTKNLTSISLTAGDWDVRGIVNWNMLSMPATTHLKGSANIGITTGVVTDDGGQCYTAFVTGGSAVSSNFSCPLPSRRLSLAATTTVYLVGAAPVFSSGSISAFGYIEARRIR